MDDRTENRILEKAEYIRESLIILAETRDSVSFETYKTDRRQRNIVEREFQTSIEACLDIGKMILRTEGAAVPDTNAAVFQKLTEHGILTDELGEKMAEAAGFRNILAHKYGDGIDDKDVFVFLQHELAVFREYLIQIREYLNSSVD